MKPIRPGWPEEGIYKHASATARALPATCIEEKIRYIRPIAHTWLVRVLDEII